jgi:ElaB/YqjD/DUF883 family membrane-anchored ribosome-binding protein
MAEQRLNEEVNNLRSDVAKLTGDVTALLTALRQMGVDNVNDARESLDDEIAKRRDSFRRNLASARARGEHTADSLEGEVARHPIRSVLVAFGIGYVMAKMTKSK